MADSMEGEVVFITGASSGIGRATAREFAKRGATLALCDVDDVIGDQVRREIMELDVPVSFDRCDVSQGAEVRETIQQVIQRYGALNHAFNNAGVAGPSAEINVYPQDEWDRVLGVNLTGVWFCMKYEIDHMLKLGAGTIVNASSIAGTVAYRGGAAYIAAKHGVLGITKTAAIEFAAAGIRVNAVCPGYVATPMVLGYGNAKMPKEVINEYVGKHPIGRLASPEELARVVVWLCADAPDFLSGQGLIVDGGYTAQ